MYFFAFLNIRFCLLLTGKQSCAKRDVLNWWGDNRQQFYGTEFSHSRKIGRLDLTIGGNYFKDEGYRMYETTVIVHESRLPSKIFPKAI